MVETIIGAVLSIIAVLLPVIIAHMARDRSVKDALTQRSLDELHAANDRMHNETPVQPK